MSDTENVTTVEPAPVEEPERPDTGAEVAADEDDDNGGGAEAA